MELDFTRIEGKLYGRTKEQSKLRQAYKRSTERSTSSRRTCELILLSGAPDTGKTALANSLKQVVTDDKGYFITIKFYEVPSDDSFAPFAADFNEFVKSVRLRGRTATATMQKAFNTELNNEDVKVLIEMSPDLEQLTGKRSEAVEQRSESPPNVEITFQKLIRAIATPGDPIVIFVDNFQWADAAASALLKELVENSEDTGVAYVAACRDNAASDSPSCCALRNLEADNIKITNIGVRSLKEEAVNEIVADLLGLEVETCKPLGSKVHSQTGGKPRFVIDILRLWMKKGLLYFNDDSNRWDWDNENICRSIPWMGEKIDDDLVRHEVCQLSPTTQDVLKLAACLGQSFDASIIQCYLDVAIEESLKVAVDRDFIYFESSGVFEFVDEQVQSAIYAFFDEEQKEHHHLQIGRVLRKRLNLEELHRHVFVVADQFTKAAPLIDDQKEKYAVASLFLMAGEKSISHSRFLEATKYLKIGISFLGASCWTDEYQLSLAMYNTAAEAECVAGFPDAVDSHTQVVFDQARTHHDSLRAHSIRVYSLGLRGNMSGAADEGIAVLKGVGETFPVRWIKAHVMYQFVKTRWRLKNMSFESLMRLPPMEDPIRVASIQIMNLVFLNIYITRPELSPLFLLRMINLTLDHGVCASASVFFSGYGFLLCSIGAMDEGYQFGQFALALVDRFNSNEWLPRTAAAVYAGTFFWKKPLSLAVEPLQQAHEIGVETGDLEFSIVNKNLYAFYRLLCCDPLLDVAKELVKNVDFALTHKLKPGLAYVVPMLQLTHNLIDQAENPVVLTGEAGDEGEIFQDCDDNNYEALRCTVYRHKLVLAYLFEDYPLAESLARKVKNAHKVLLSTIEIVDICLFSGLTYLALAQRCKRRSKRKRKLVRAAGCCITKMRGWTRHCKWNFLHNLLLLEAEYYALMENSSRAVSKYMCAIGIFGNQGLWMQHAISCERAGKYIFKNGDSTEGRMYLDHALNSYDKWGAKAKSKVLKKQIQEKFTTIEYGEECAHC